MIAIAQRRVVQGLSLLPCVAPIRENGLQSVGVRYVYCDGIFPLDLRIAQNADKTFQFKDAATTDYSLATEITFDIWQNNISGASLYSASLTGGEITLIADNVFSLTIDNTESGAFPARRHYCEAWVTLPGSVKRCVGAGGFLVIDTRKHD